MGDRLLAALTSVPFIIWGIISIINPTIAFRYQFGGSRNRRKTPDKYELLYYKTIGYVFIVLGASLLIAALLGGLTD